MHTNRLAQESSPYLLQHAHNPVDWYPWGPEAIEASRSQNKPIFLSVGYSTCYWCHVMERQCFEVEAIAAEMNARFINIKVDREERPDVDQLYMTAVQVMTQQGGWPMSVFLTPDLKPFYGGTYFPPTDAYGRPGFPTVLRSLDNHFQNRREDVEKSADQLVEILKQVAEPQGSRTAITIDDTLVDRIIVNSTGDYEPVHGGFGGAPKFPRETLLELLLTRSAKPASGPASGVLEMVRHALDAMANGGIRDHLGGGFHRYSTDAQWLVPHFEIMLYDNAMLGWCYAEAHRQTGEARYAAVARGIFDFVLREMTSPSGAFYTAFDAEVDAQEGLSYLWTEAEIGQILGDEGTELFSRVYGVDRGPNFADPHHGTGQANKNILFLPEGPKEESDPRIIAMRGKLYEARRNRKQPLLDTKVLTSWNALMIRAMAFASKVLNEPRYLEAASSAADFLLKHHRKPDGGLFRTSRLDADPPSNAKLDAFLDDYAFFAQALLALHESSGEARWLDAAKQLCNQMIARFHDESRGGFYFTDRGATDLIVRQKIATDSPLPSGNGIAAGVALRLGRTDVARGTLSVFANQLQSHGEGMNALVQAAMEYVHANGTLTVEPGAQSSRPLSPRELAESVVSLEAQWIDSRQLAIFVKIENGYHINANQPSGDLIATQLQPADASLIESIEYPAGEEQRFAFSDAPVRVYSRGARIFVRFHKPVEKSVEMSLLYQACDDSACLAPVGKRFEVPPP